MRGISLMYELSGGCNYEHTCGECKFYEDVKTAHGFSKSSKKKVGNSGVGVCYKHPLRVPEWKPSLMACKWWKSPYQKTIVKSTDNQCEGQMTLDTFL